MNSYKSKKSVQNKMKRVKIKANQSVHFTVGFAH